MRAEVVAVGTELLLGQVVDTNSSWIGEQLALAGIESKVQKVTVDSDTWHRVRVGPITNLDELNRLRARLRQADVDALVIRVGD